MTKTIIRTVELFAGVGGFRLGLEGLESPPKSRFRTIWANQWEPGRKVQHAFNCYCSHFGIVPEHVNEDINDIVKNASERIPKHELLVGGFPCQDYSVARTQARGIEGKKGVLWWAIKEILDKKRPPYVLLENVDRLLKSPASQRGRDFGVILRCFYDLGYRVEWRVINAAEYGEAQRRRRVFIFAFQEGTPLHRQLDQNHLVNWIRDDGFFIHGFPIDKNYIPKVRHEIASFAPQKNGLYTDLKDVSDNFKFEFQNAGVMFDGFIYTEDVKPVAIVPKVLRQVRETNEVDKRYFIGQDRSKWLVLKGAKKVPRVKPNGENYFYAEGPMSFPDSLDMPARTMLTSESTVNRSSHVIEDAASGDLRLLTPVECERLNGFPDGWTDTGMPHRLRYFMMGNALVVPMITRMGKVLADMIP